MTHVSDTIETMPSLRHCCLLILAVFCGPAFGVLDPSRNCFNVARDAAYSVNDFLEACDSCYESNDQRDKMGSCNSNLQMAMFCLSKVDRCSNDALGCNGKQFGAPLVNCESTTARTTPVDETTGPCEAGKKMDVNTGDCVSDARSVPTTRPGTTPTTTPSTTTPRAPAPTSGSASADQNTCAQARDQAYSACQNVGVSTNTTQQDIRPNESIPEYCARMHNAANNSSAANGSYAQQCNNAHTTCSSTCSSLANKWPGTAEASNMQSAASSCRDLDSRVQLAANQGLSLKGNSQYSSLCGTQAQSMNPSGGGGGSPGGGAGGSGSSPSSANSAAREAALQKQAEEAAKAAAAKADFKTMADQAKASDMNVNSMNTAMSGYTGNGEFNPNIDKIPGGNGKGGQPFANNSGGQIPGQGGDSGGAKIGGGRGGSPGSPGYASTDIMKGFQGAGGGTAGGSTATKGDGDAFKGYGGGRMPANEKGLDLRQYLPGGQKDPGIRYGGLKYENILGVHGPHVNLWFRINTRILEKCKLGELFSCELK